MRKPLPFTVASRVGRVVNGKDKARTKSEYQRVLCLFFRAKTELHPEQIAEVL